MESILRSRSVGGDWEAEDKEEGERREEELGGGGEELKREETENGCEGGREDEARVLRREEVECVVEGSEPRRKE